MKSDTHFLSYLAQFFLEREMFRTEVVEKIKTLILCSESFFRKSRRLRDNVEKKNIVERGRTQITIWLTRIAVWISDVIYTHTSRTCNIYCFSTVTMVARAC
jgi:hypothetical protein